MNADAKQDLTIRLEQLVGEFAPASDRRGGVEKLHAILERVPETKDDESLLDELDALDTQLTAARAGAADSDKKLADMQLAHERLTAELEAANKTIEERAADVTRLTAELEAATKPTT